MRMNNRERLKKCHISINLCSTASASSAKEWNFSRAHTKTTKQIAERDFDDNWNWVMKRWKMSWIIDWKSLDVRCLDSMQLKSIHGTILSIISMSRPRARSDKLISVASEIMAWQMYDIICCSLRYGRRWWTQLENNHNEMKWCKDNVRSSTQLYAVYIVND